MKVLLNRMREPSTYAGLAALLAVAGVTMVPADVQSVVYLLSGLAGVVAMFVPEAKAAA